MPPPHPLAVHHPPAAAPPRRRDAVQTRALILDTARTHFAGAGFAHVTVRAIAADAGVSPNLITRYFGGKRGLFTAATEVDLRIREVLPGPRSELGLRIATQVLNRWDERPGNDPLLAMMRAAMSDPEAAAHMARYFRQQAVVPLAEHLGAPDGHERSAAVSSLIMGTVVQRYVLTAGPAAEATRPVAQAWLAHALQILLSGPAFPPL